VPIADIVTCSTEVEPVSPRAVPTNGNCPAVSSFPTCFQRRAPRIFPHNALSLTQKSRHPSEGMAPATDFILSALAQEGLDHLFMVPGGLVDPFLPALGRAPQVRAIVAAQEGGAAYMADGYARASGRFGAALCIGGPGLCNMTTAVAAAKPMRRLSWSSVERLQLRWKVSAPFRMRVRQRSTTPPS
jgi:hypothetical protein